MNAADSSPGYRQALESAARFIREHDHFLVVSHVQPDGDAVSSTCAVGWILEQCGKRFVLINEGEIPRKFRFLYGCDRIVNMRDNPPSGPFRHVICVDCADFKRIGEVSRLFADDCAILNIDHHPTNDRYGTVHVIRDDAAATAELLYDLIRTMGLSWTRESAELVYTGMMTDTGGFRYANTTPKVMQAAAELLSHGVKGAELAEALLETVTYPHIQLLKRALATLQFDGDRRIAWMVVTQGDMKASGAGMDDLEGLVNYPRNIEGVQVGLLFKETGPREFKVSMRSNGQADVSAIAQLFGGGGHVRAAGASLEGDAEEVIGRVLDAVKAALA